VLAVGATWSRQRLKCAAIGSGSMHRIDVNRGGNNALKQPRNPLAASHEFGRLGDAPGGDGVWRASERDSKGKGSVKPIRYSTIGGGQGAFSVGFIGRRPPLPATGSW
jgi:hypothetical protein